MAAEGISALLLGKLFDSWGMKSMIYITIVSLFFAPMVFLGGFIWAIFGMVVWGIGMGAQESVLKAAVAELIPTYKRGTAFGAFNAGFGIFWFLGSVTLGYLYDFSIPWLVIFSIVMQAIAVIIFWIIIYHSKNNKEISIVR